MFNMIQYVVSGALTMWDASNGAFWMILIGSSFWLVDVTERTDDASYSPWINLTPDANSKIKVSRRTSQNGHRIPDRTSDSPKVCGWDNCEADIGLREAIL